MQIPQLEKEKTLVRHHVMNYYENKYLLQMNRNILVQEEKWPA